MARQLEQWVERVDPSLSELMVFSLRRRRHSGMTTLLLTWRLLKPEQIWCTKTFQPLYIIHPCDDTAGDIYSLAWDDRAGGTLYFGELTWTSLA